MIQPTLIIVGVLCTFYAEGQGHELVRNGGFEEYTQVPTYLHQIARATGWSNCNGFDQQSDNHGTPDFYHKDGYDSHEDIGQVEPHSGRGCAAFITKSWSGDPDAFREFISTQLIEPLEYGKVYIIEFYLVNSSNYQHATNNIGVYFSHSQPSQYLYFPIDVEPQVELDTVFYSEKWKKVTFTFEASSAFQFITIGNFRMDAETLVDRVDYEGGYGAYYFIDDISIKECVKPRLQLPDDFYGCYGQKMIVDVRAQNEGLGDISYFWSDSVRGPVRVMDASGNYWLEAHNECGSSGDGIYIQLDTCEVDFRLPNIVTPNGDLVNDAFKPISLGGVQELTLQVFNRWGQVVYQTNNTGFEWHITDDFSDGTYYIRADYFDFPGESYTYTGTLTILR